MSNKRNAPYVGGLKGMRSDDESEEVEDSLEEVEEEDEEFSESGPDDGEGPALMARSLLPAYAQWAEAWPATDLLMVASGLAKVSWTVYPKNVASILAALSAQWQRGDIASHRRVPISGPCAALGWAAWLATPARPLTQQAQGGDGPVPARAPAGDV